MVEFQVLHVFSGSALLAVLVSIFCFHIVDDGGLHYGRPASLAVLLIGYSLMDFLLSGEVVGTLLSFCELLAAFLFGTG